jgi:NADH-quinone oxidoreductase subunit C
VTETPKPTPGEAGGATVQPGAPGASSSVDRPASVQTGTHDEPGAADFRTDEHAGDAIATPTPSLPGAAGSAPVTGLQRTGMFGAHGSGDTSGYGLLQREPYRPVPAERPFGGDPIPGMPEGYGVFDEMADALFAAMAAGHVPPTAVEQITVAHREITFYLAREHLSQLLWIVRDDPSLRFELLSSLSGVDYGEGVPRRLHVVYELTSMTYRRRARLEVAVDVTDPHVPSAVPTYPTADWHERETWDMFGIVFDGHPGLTRILMPDDWEGHPQRKDYPLGGIPVEYKGAEIPAPDTRRTYG